MADKYNTFADFLTALVEEYGETKLEFDKSDGFDGHVFDSNNLALTERQQEGSREFAKFLIQQANERDVDLDTMTDLKEIREMSGNPILSNEEVGTYLAAMAVESEKNLNEAEKTSSQEFDIPSSQEELNTILNTAREMYEDTYIDVAPSLDMQQEQEIVDGLAAAFGAQEATVQPFRMFNAPSSEAVIMLKVGNSAKEANTIIDDYLMDIRDKAGFDHDDFGFRAVTKGKNDIPGYVAIIGNQAEMRSFLLELEEGNIDLNEMNNNIQNNLAPATQTENVVLGARDGGASQLRTYLEDAGYELEGTVGIGELKKMQGELEGLTTTLTDMGIDVEGLSIQEMKDIARERVGKVNEASTLLEDIKDGVDELKNDIGANTITKPEAPENIKETEENVDAPQKTSETAASLMQMLANRSTTEQPEKPLEATPEEVAHTEVQVAAAKKIIIDLNDEKPVIAEPEPFVNANTPSSLTVDKLKDAIDSGALFGRGSQGEDEIKELQTFLAEHGLYNDEIDGQLGPLTKSGIEIFQAQQGIAVDGIAGPETLGKMQQTNIVSMLDLNGDAMIDVAEIQAATSKHNVVAANDGTYKIDDIEVALNTPNETLARASGAER